MTRVSRWFRRDERPGADVFTSWAQAHTAASFDVAPRYPRRQVRRMQAVRWVSKRGRSHHALAGRSRCHTCGARVPYGLRGVR